MFIKDFKYNFKKISDSKTVLYSAERKSIITTIRCTNISDINIRITLEEKCSLKDPVEEAYLCYKLLLPPNQTVDLLMVTKGNSSVISEHTMLDGDGLFCYTESFSEKFSCSIIGYEILEE